MNEKKNKLILLLHKINVNKQQFEVKAKKNFHRNADTDLKMRLYDIKPEFDECR